MLGRDLGLSWHCPVPEHAPVLSCPASPLPLKCNLLQAAPRESFQITDREMTARLGVVVNSSIAPAVQNLDDNNAHTTKPDDWRAIAKPQAATPIGGGDRTDKWWAGLENCHGFNVVCVHPNNGNVLKGQLVWNEVSIGSAISCLVRTEEGQVVTTTEFERMAGRQTKNPKRYIKFADGDRAE